VNIIFVNLKSLKVLTMAMTSCNNLESLTSVCQSMMDLVERLDSLDQRVYRLKSEIMALSNEHTDMNDFLRRGRNIPSMLQGLTSAKRPFHGLERMQQFEMMKKCILMRTDLSFKFEALREAKTSLHRSKIIREVLASENPVSAPGGSYLSDNLEETEYIKGLLSDTSQLASSIMTVEEQRIAKALENLDGKTKIIGLLSKCKKDSEDNQDSMEEEEEGGLEANEETKALNKKRYQLNRAEKKVTQMKTVIQKLMLSYPDAALESDDESIKEDHENMLFYCGKTIEEMRQDL